MRNGKAKQDVRFAAAFLTAAIMVLWSVTARAEIKIIEADSAYVMGDNDSKVDARRIATQEAKRKALELAGTFVASLTQVKEYKLTKDEVTAYTAGVVETEIIADETRGSLDHPEIYIRAKCRIDTGVLLVQIDNYRENEELRDQLETSAKEKESLRKERDELQKQLAAEQDKAKAEETRKKLDAVLTHEETIDDTNRVWARLSPQMDFYSGGEINREARIGDLEDTAVILEKAINVNPKNQQARLLLASVYEQKSDRARAEKLLRNALEREPYNPLLHIRLGILLREQGRHHEALKEFRLIEQKRPNQPHMLFQTGLTHKASGNCRLAAAYLKRFLMYTKRVDKPDVARLKPRAIEALKECGQAPPRQRPGRTQPPPGPHPGGPR